MRLYLDTSVIIHWVERAVPEVETKIIAALRKCAPQSPLLCWSDLTRMECRVRPLRRQDSVLLAYYEEFFSQPVAVRLSMTAAVFDHATRLRVHHNLKTPDALHLAAALEGDCTEFWTSDDKLNRVAGEYLRTVAF